MKIIISISILAFLICCCQGHSRSNAVQFTIDSVSVSLPCLPEDIIHFKGGYVCLFDTSDTLNPTLGVLDKHFRLDAAESKRLSAKLKYVASIWTSNDTLYAIEYRYANQALIKSYWNGSTWRAVSSDTVKRKNYMSNELNLPLYKDNSFEVHSCCRGEFGGAVFFHDLKTHNVYSCPSTCLNSIYKVNGEFIVSSSLPHGDGFSTIIKISDPKNLFQITDKRMLCDCSWYDIYPERTQKIDLDVEHPDGFDRGYDTILDSFGIVSLQFFRYKLNDYLVYTDHRKTYIGKVDKGRIQNPQRLLNMPVWFSELRDLKHNGRFAMINCRWTRGIIMRNGNHLRFIHFLVKHPSELQ